MKILILVNTAQPMKNYGNTWAKDSMKSSKARGLLKHAIRDYRLLQESIGKRREKACPSVTISNILNSF